MVTSDEKREFLESLIEYYSGSKNVEGIQSKLHALLLRDTANGRLYKYRSFDKNGYSLVNLSNNTLRCSKPSDFNDPFDSKAGIRINTLYMAQYPEANRLLTSVFEKYPLVLNGSISISNCTVEEKHLIEKLLSDNILNGYLNKNAETNTPVENTSFVVRLIQVVLSDTLFENSLKPFVKPLCEMLAHIDSDKILTLTDETELYKELAQTSGIESDSDELSLTTSISKKLFPEQTVSLETTESIFQNMEMQLSEAMDNMFRIGCLCTDFKNRLMWSHYADSHKGFCIEYDFSGQDKSIFTKLPFPVYYSNSRPQIPWEYAIDNSPSSIARASEHLMLGMLAKDSAWEYENEWRILIGTNEPPDLIMPKITCIYLGACITDDNRSKILDIAKKNGIPVKQMKVDRGIYELHAEDILF